MSRESVNAVVPQLYVESVEKAREFYIQKLGFSHMMGVVGKDGRLDFGIVTRNGAMVMFARPEERIEGSGERYPTKRPVELYIHVSDVDGYHEEVKSRGAAAVEALKTQWWGDRNFAVQDPYGYRIWFYETVKEWKEVSPPSGIKVV